MNDAFKSSNKRRWELQPTFMELFNKFARVSLDWCLCVYVLTFDLGNSFCGEGHRKNLLWANFRDNFVCIFLNDAYLWIGSFLL